MAGLLALGLCACTSDDNLIADGGDNASSLGENVYMQLRLQMPTSTRSSTTSSAEDSYVISENGTEAGQTTENQVTNAYVVLTYSTNNKFIAATEISSDLEAATSSKDLYTATFSESALASALGESVNVFVFCNPTSDLTTSFTTETESDKFTVDKVCNIGDSDPSGSSTIWSDNSFLMSNAKLTTETLPSSTEITSYTSEANPYDLGTVDVERSVARFDYNIGTTSDKTSLTFDMKDADNNATGVTVTLTSLALVNLSDNFYYLRRVSADGTSSSATICGVETSTNYVVDTDESDKTSYNSSSKDLSDNFLYQFGKTDVSNYKWTNFSDLENIDDESSYAIWRYATENTIPAEAKTAKGITTGIAFKAKLGVSNEANNNIKSIFGENSGANDNNSNHNPIFVFHGTLIGTWDQIKSLVESYEDDGELDNDQIEEDGNMALVAAYEQVLTAMESCESEEGSDAYKAALVEAQADANFTAYSYDTTDGCYYTIYYYWNIHNTATSNDGTISPMEYAVVRNNVYKLRVTNINTFGHPADSTTPDGDPEEPDDPVETVNLYMEVELYVLPWTVRENEDIQF